jgi:hypothetical protein
MYVKLWSAVGWGTVILIKWYIPMAIHGGGGGGGGLNPLNKKILFKLHQKLRYINKKKKN